MQANLAFLTFNKHLLGTYSMQDDTNHPGGEYKFFQYFFQPHAGLMGLNDKASSANS